MLANVFTILSTDAVIDVEKGREDLGKAQKYKQAAMKKKCILIGILIAVVVIVLLSKYRINLCSNYQSLIINQFSVILYEFGAFSGGGGGTTIVEKHIYHHTYENGTKVVSEGEDPTLVKDGTVVLGTSSTTTPVPTAINEVEKDYI